MTIANSLHNFIQDYNILTTPTTHVREYFDSNPHMEKVALIANHVFRAIAMTAFCLAMPFSMPANITICFVASLLYRLTVETNCAYKFALPAFVGGAALPYAISGAAELVSYAAFSSLSSFALAIGSFVPLAGYAAYVVLTVSYDVDNR